jgi:hypothetical protein
MACFNLGTVSLSSLLGYLQQLFLFHDLQIRIEHQELLPLVRFGDHSYWGTSDNLLLEEFLLLQFLEFLHLLRSKLSLSQLTDFNALDLPSEDY